MWSRVMDGVEAPGPGALGESVTALGDEDEETGSIPDCELPSRIEELRVSPRSLSEGGLVDPRKERGARRLIHRHHSSDGEEGYQTPRKPVSPLISPQSSFERKAGNIEEVEEILSQKQQRGRPSLDRLFLDHNHWHRSPPPQPMSSPVAEAREDEILPGNLRNARASRIREATRKPDGFKAVNVRARPY